LKPCCVRLLNSSSVITIGGSVQDGGRVAHFCVN
jgi:hypothetical protein